jgi:hypothetical protein
MGGLMSSVVLTLLVLPYFHTVMEALGAWLGRIWRNSARTVEPALGATTSADGETAAA